MLVEALRQLMWATFEFTLPCEMTLKISTEGFGQHCFSTAHRTGDDRSGGSIGRGQGGKLRGQLALNVFSSDQFFGDVIKIQHLRVSDDEPSADAVQIVHHIKGMLMSTVLKDVVPDATLGGSLFRECSPSFQGISSNW